LRRGDKSQVTELNSDGACEARIGPKRDP